MPRAIVHAWILSHSSSGLVCTSPLASFETKMIVSNLGRITVCVATHSRSGISSSMSITSSALCSLWSLCASSISLMAKIGTAPKLLGTIFCLMGKMHLTNLSMKEVPERPGTTNSGTALKTTLTLESYILKCSAIVLPTLTFSLVIYFNSGKLFLCISRSNFFSRMSFRIRFHPTPASNV